jgi:hypothetical protein
MLETLSTLDTWNFSGEESHGNLSFLEAVIRDYRHKGDG